MAVENKSLKNRKKRAAKLSTKDSQQKSKAKICESEFQFGTSNKLRNCFSFFVYITAFLVVLSCLSWLILCNTLCKDLEFCSVEFLARFMKRPMGNLNESQSIKEHVDSMVLESQTSVPKSDVSLWVVERRSSLSLDEFIQKYDGKRPVLITDALKEWKAINKWNKEFFAKNYGDQRIVMKAVQGSLSQAESLALPMKLFAKHSHMASPDIWTYLEDELFIQLHPELKKDLGKPIYLKEDFFQMFPREVRPWNAMLLWGTQYSRSSLHIDPYNWTGTNAVFSGKKLWKLYPPGQDEYLYVLLNRKSEFPLNCYKYNSPVDAFNPDLKKYPNFSKARAISFEQKPGELLIIPPGWFHQAFNAVETIAVSSQVLNSQNYHIILEEIFKAGNIDRKSLPSDFYQLPAVEQVMFVVNSLPSKVIQRGRVVTNEILQQMGYPTK